MALMIRDVREHELDQVLALNNSAGPSILPLDAPSIRYFFDRASYFRVAEIDGHLAGFLIALHAGTDYASENYRWFHSVHEDFVYIDRIVVASNYRRHGLGRIFYADVQSYAEMRSPYLTCEIFLEPRDDASILFHGTYGFREVGQRTCDTGRRVGMLSKEMCSYPFVREHYWESATGALPSLPWLAERPHATASMRDVVNAN